MLEHYQPPTEPYLRIIYQDDAIVILDKPNGLLTVPGRLPEHQDSLELRVKRVFPTARIVHRLDMATSGIVLMALTAEAQKHLNLQFEKRVPRKHYIARVEGLVQAQRGHIELPLRCDWPNRPKQMVCFDHGKHALTRFEVLERETDATRVQLKPVTGRSHQLRVHMQWLGHPILGDKFYASPKGLKAAHRLQLHAAWLSFRHPTHQGWVEFNSPCPF